MQGAGFINIHQVKPAHNLLGGGGGEEHVGGERGAQNVIAERVIRDGSASLPRGEVQCVFGGRGDGSCSVLSLNQWVPSKLVKPTPPPFHALELPGIPLHRHPHNDHGRTQDLADISQVNGLGKSRNVLGLRRERGQEPGAVARNDEKQKRSQEKNADRQPHRRLHQRPFDRCPVLARCRKGPSGARRADSMPRLIS